ncbi:MAG: division/cell wall cluster transcriptional repressor MraZ [Anaerolineales bacterium]|nr:division/cell wall cluster transcriptional repressor MraZ [Anaerolineales bacterium]
MINEQMFLGEYYHTLDNKGRITIPAVFRNQFTDGCVLTRGWEGYLIIYNKQAFMRMVRKSQELSPTVPEHRVLQRVMFSSAREAQFDKLGRVNVPAFLRGYAGLDKEVVLAGVGSWIEVWNQRDWELQLQNVNDSDANADRFAALNLAMGSGGLADE